MTHITAGSRINEADTPSHADVRSGPHRSGVLLMARYERMDLADASIVVMTELHKRCQVLTLDRKDFSIYRRNDRQTIDFIAPRKP